MKLIEIKNNFAKLYYHPNEDDLLIAGFVTINDGNQQVIAQIISSESTSQDDTNCAVLKFSFSFGDKKELVPYNGYIPSLDAKVQKTDAAVLKRRFSKRNNLNNFCLGEFTSFPDVDLCLDYRFFEDFVYIQSDRTTNIQCIFNALTTGIDSGLVIDTDGTINTESTDQFTLCENFKLPVNIDTLNYIYEQDLTGLQIEQKAVVQDIILEIQDYIRAEKRGFIPFSTLLSVVDDVYENEKSIGIILFRNKLIKYHQNNLFASEESEFKNFFNALQGTGSTSINLQHVSNNWKKETINFIINYCNSAIHLFMYIDDALTDKETLARIHQKSNIRPIIASKYDSDFANQIKSYAKNLIMFAPEEIQERYPTYSTFLSKLTEEEFIVSGVETMYTPIIVRPPSIKAVISEPASSYEARSGSDYESDEDMDNLAGLSDEDTDTFEIAGAYSAVEPELEAEPEEEPSPIREIFEDAVEAEIETGSDDSLMSEAEPDAESSNGVNYEDLFSEEDLDLLDDLSTLEDHDDNYGDDSEQVHQVDLYESALEGEEEVKDEIFEDGPLLGGMEQPLFSREESFSGLAPEGMPVGTYEDYDYEPEPVATKAVIEDVFDDENSLSFNMHNNVMQKTPVQQSSSSIPVYKAVYDENIRTNDIGFAEGNIVYHQKYGRGVVEQIISYGKKTLCSIQFDNVGRRLLDPNLADLRQA